MSAIIKFFRSRTGKQVNPTQERARFENLLRPHIELLYRMAYRWTQSQDRAEDLVQDVLTRLASRVTEMEAIESLKPWLVRILYNRYVDDYRRQRASPIDESHSGWVPDEENTAPDPVNQAIDPVQPIAQEELRLSLHKALAYLEAEQRDLVLLHDMEGYSAEEAAEILGIPLGTVKSRLHRARAKLKLLLFDDDG